MCTRQSRKVIWDMINTLFLTTVAVEPTFVAFLQHSKTHFHGLSCQFFQISLKNRELKTTHNAFRDCRVLLRQPFSKQLYTRALLRPSSSVVFHIISNFILLHEKFLQFNWLRAVVFQFYLKYLHVKITILLWVVVIQHYIKQTIS